MRRRGGHASGAGSPIFFRCPVERRLGEHVFHDVERTGRVKPYRPSRALGSRSMHERHEYRCRTCGHVGWTNHIDILKKPLGEEAITS